MFHFTGLLGGPTIYYTEYEDVMSKPAKRERYPAVLRTLLTGMVAFALFGATCQWHSLDDFLDPSIREKSLFSRLIVLYVFMLGMPMQVLRSLEAGRKHVFVERIRRKRNNTRMEQHE